jgi:hypothetical protein
LREIFQTLPQLRERSGELNCVSLLPFAEVAHVIATF